MSILFHWKYLNIPYLSYDIKVTPDFEAFTFKGEIVIHLKTKPELEKDCKEIVMHAKELCFISASFTIAGKDEPAVKAEEFRDNKKATTVTFVFPETVPASSTVILTIQYMGFLNNQVRYHTYATFE